MLHPSAFISQVKCEVFDIICEFNPLGTKEFERKFAHWVREVKRLQPQISEQSDRFWDLAVKYGGSGAPHRVYGWLAAGIFHEYSEHIDEDASYEELQAHMQRLLDNAGRLIDEKFVWDERHEEEKTIILGLLEKRLKVFLDTLRPTSAPDISGEWQKYRKAIIGSSRKLEKVLKRAAKAARFGVSVLIAGETGVGKELIAAFIHQMSPRARRPFVAVNCAAISPYLFEAELFGYQKGAFTGAVAQKKGLVEAAHAGTLFLDEIGDLSLDHQSKILRFLQEGQFQRVGSLGTARSDVRIIAATNRDLKEAVREGRFREDLYYRLATVSIHVPPLRERPGDVEELVEHFLKAFSRAESIPVRSATAEAMAYLRKYPWPGNVRELKNVIEEALVMCETTAIGVADLHPYILGPHGTRAHSGEASEAYLKMLAPAGEDDSRFLDIKSLLQTVRTNLIPLLKKLFFRVVIEFLIRSRGLSFRFKDLVDFLSERNIGTPQSRLKLAQQALAECSLVQDNGGKTKQHRLRLTARFLVPPFNQTLPALDKALIEEGMAPHHRFLFEDFVMNHGEWAFSAEELEEYIGTGTWDFAAAVKKKLLCLIHATCHTTVFIPVG
jgi:DNA-binding NtrC family response regulator